jgi:hypothetical protein
VVIDGITEAMTLMGLKILDNTDVAVFLAKVARPLAARGCAVLLLDHVTKDRETRGRGAIGAQHKLAGVDVAYTIDVIRPFGRGLEGLSRLTVTKDRPGFIRAASASRKFAADITLYSEGEEVAVVLKPVEVKEPDPLGLSPAQRRVLEALPPEPGMFPKEIGDRVVEQGWEAGLHRVTIQNALAVLAELKLATAPMVGGGGVVPVPSSSPVGVAVRGSHRPPLHDYTCSESSGFIFATPTTPLGPPNPYPPRGRGSVGVHALEAAEAVIREVCGDENVAVV